MRKERDGDSTKQLVIAAAKEAFAERGYAGTSLAAVSARSGISMGLILYHFKNKENLYRVVLEDLAGGYYAAITQAPAAVGQPEEVMGEMLRATFRYWSEDSTYNKISTWAYLENRTEIINEEAKLTLGLASKLEEMQSAGRFDPRFSPFVLLSMTIGPIQFWIQHRELFKNALHLDLPMEELNALFLKQYIDLVAKLYRPE